MWSLPRKWLVVLVSATLISFLHFAAPAVGAEEVANCVEAGWEGVEGECAWSYDEYLAASTSDSEHVWERVPLCEDPLIASCAAQVACSIGGEPGMRFYVFRDGINLGMMCVPMTVVDPGPSDEDVRKAFRSLSWPGSSLIVQPPGGRTLVNLDTFFYTSNFEPISKTVTLVGRQVEIVATPVSYRWVFGDGVVADTRGAGGPYPDGDVRHVYGQPGEMTARVATTYSGRYRIGRRAWRDIPETLTVPGEGVGLVVVEAKPQLVVR